jgi:ribosomal protection tetracycline resistance protein
VAADFRNLAPVVVLAALRRAGTRVCQPVDRFELDLPDEGYGPVVSLLGRLGAATLDSVASGGGYTRLAGHVPATGVADLTARLPDLTSGGLVLVTALHHHAPLTAGPPPSRRRTGFDPLDRTTWFRHVPR